MPQTVSNELLRFEQLLREGFIKADNVEIVRADGTRRITDFTATVVRVGDEQFVFRIERDVTEERRLAEQVRLYQRMESIVQLTGGVAHDFNNILAVILSYSQFLIDELQDGDPRRQDAEEIRKAGARGASLTRQLLAYSRRQVLEPTNLNLNDILPDIQKMLHRLVGSDIELSFVADPLLGTVTADRAQIEQVIMNLVVNARDAMPRGGKLCIETSNIELDQPYADDHVPVVPGSYVMLSVRDTGCGMDAETKRRAFEPFFTTKERDKGTGLGLSTCYGIVKQSGGYIWLYSEPGHGTVFRVYLPRIAGEASAVARAPIAEHSPCGSETILIVEDDPAVRGAVSRILQERGYRVLLAQDGHEAVSVALTHDGPVHLILSDVIIPGTSGLELLQKVKERFSDAKVLFMSGYADHAILRDDVLQPRMNFLQKPFTPNALTNKVRAVLAA